MGRIITLTGDSGTGKSLLANSLAKRGYQFVISTTTRTPRPLDNKGELEYISLQEFQQLKDKLVWDTNPFGQDYYGTKKEYLDTALTSKEYYMMILVPEVVPTLLAYGTQKHPEAHIIPFFLNSISKEEAERRMREREDSQEGVERRVTNVGKWEEEARKSTVPYRFMNSTLKPEELLNYVLRYLESYDCLMGPKTLI